MLLQYFHSIFIAVFSTNTVFPLQRMLSPYIHLGLIHFNHHYFVCVYFVLLSVFNIFLGNLRSNFFCFVRFLLLCFEYINGGCILTRSPSGPARRFHYDDAGWNQSMASNNRVFPCIHTKIVPTEEKCQAIFNSFSNPQVILVLLLFHRDFDLCSALYTNNTVSYSALCNKSVLFFAFVRPRTSLCEDGTLHDYRTVQTNPSRCH